MSDVKLYVVSLPIGNLGEVTFLAKKILTETKLIICEDTRSIKKFFILNDWSYKNINFVSYHKFNESSRIDYIQELLEKNKTGVLVSDAGYPGICDPGSKIILACRQNGVDIQVVNGPCALIHCLVASGWSTFPFLFSGFSSHSLNQIRKQLKKYYQFYGVIIFYVSVYALDNFVNGVENVFTPDCEICVGRELTKKHEEILVGKLSEIKNKLIKKGEFVFLIKNTNHQEKLVQTNQLSMVADLIKLGIRRKQAFNFLKKYYCFSSRDYEKLNDQKVIKNPDD